jgi:creatinine amidohydrolase
MAPRPYLLAESNWKTVKETEYDVAVLPWGATEAHNFHLPYNTDVAECDYIAAESARIAWEQGARVITLPTVPFGVNTGQLDIKLDINLYPSTQAAILNDVVDALTRNGILKLVVLNGHGGNDFKQMIRETQAFYPGSFISQVNWYRILDNAAYFDKPGDHAGEMETSVMMEIAPDLVRPLDEAGDGAARTFKVAALREGWAWAERDWSEVTESTGVGDPYASTAQKGARFLKDVTEKIASYYVELAAVNLEALYE